MNLEYSPIEMILKTTQRLPIGKSELETVLAQMKRNAKHGLPILFHPLMETTGIEGLADGVLMLTSPLLGRDFLFVKINGGQGLFGRQKHKILSYIGSVEDDGFMAGTVFRSIAVAITSINNIFRAEGLATGPII